MATQLDHTKHTSRVFDPPGQHEGDEERFDVDCDLCGWIAAAAAVEETEALALLHEQFVAVLVANSEIPEEGRPGPRPGTGPAAPMSKAFCVVYLLHFSGRTVASSTPLRVPPLGRTPSRYISPTFALLTSTVRVRKPLTLPATSLARTR